MNPVRLPPNRGGGGGLLLSLALILLSACQQTPEKHPSDTLFHQFIQVNPSNWQREDTLTITLPAVDSITTTQATLHLRALAAFPLTTLRLRLLIDNAQNPQRQLIDIPIYPAENKNNTQNSPLGIETQTPIGSLTLYPHQTTTLRITHAMQQQSITGIRSIGIQLQHTP